MFNPAMNAKRPANLGQFLLELQGAEQGQGAPMQQPMGGPVAMQQQQEPSNSMPEPFSMPRPAMGGIFGRSPAQRPMPNPAGAPGSSKENPKKLPFFQRPNVQRGITSFADTLIRLRSGINPGIMDNYNARERAQSAQQFEQAQYERKRQAEFDDTMAIKQAELNAPQYFMSGKDRVQYDPTTGESNVLYDGPEQFQIYAQSLGYEPGTPEYVSAVQDAMLKSSGPTAYGYDRELDDYRTENDIKRKGAPTYLQSNPRTPAPRRGSAPRTSKPRSSSKRPTATGPGGKRIEWNGSAWVPAN